MLKLEDMVTRREIVETARGFAGTPFVHQGRTPGIGLDCVGVPLVLGEILELTDVSGQPILGTDYDDYGPQPQADVVLDVCLQRLKLVTRLLVGCVLAIRYPTVVCHSGIVTAPNKFVHADPGMEKVVETDLTAGWMRRVKAIFEYPGTR